MAEDKALQLLLDDHFKEFNQHVLSNGGMVDLSSAKLRARDLRHCNLKKANLSHAYFRLADLRGLDLSEANLEGASLRDAKISGVLFPKNIDANEILLSVLQGTRIRLR